MGEIKKVLMRRDSLSEEAAENLIDEARNQLKKYLDKNRTDLAGDICAEFFGLEPDYLMELI